ncbi:MAG TPA: L-threonine 3-dehydrogenase [Peptococcaceae bacterium]|nr:MAG: Alcohol dehydrogenase GroES domain protein [Moorella sp. 60_41]HBT47614.1 L-threonine 3-dehydrogenase [Peptococcaceae bacterium]
MERMKGLVKVKPEPGAELLHDLPVPEVKGDEILVKVKYAAICGTDLHIYDWTPYAQERVKPPMVFGHEFSGEVVAVGPEVKKFKVGDRVAGETHIACGMCFQCETGNAHICEDMKIIGVHTEGCFADYIKIPAGCGWKLSDSISWEIGALLEPLGVAVHSVLADAVNGMSVVIYGCGPIGLMAVNVARACGATQVIAVEPVAEKLAIAKEMGATHTLQPGKDDVIAGILELTGGRGADVIVELSGNGQAISECFRGLRKGGRVTLAGLPNGPVTLDLVDGVIYKEAKILGVTGRRMYDTWWQIEALLGAGKLNLEPVIGGIFPLERYREAFDALHAGRPGKMLLAI